MSEYALNLNNEYGNIYKEYINIDGINGKSAIVRVGWIEKDVGKYTLTTLFVDEKRRSVK